MGAEVVWYFAPRTADRARGRRVGGRADARGQQQVLDATHRSITVRRSAARIGLAEPVEKISSPLRSFRDRVGALHARLIGGFHAQRHST